MAFLQEPRVKREPFLNAPASVTGLIGVIVAAHLARVAGSDALSNDLIQRFSFVPARYSATGLDPSIPNALPDQVLPFFGYMFLHANFTHLIVNCLWLLAFGPVVARRLGTARFFAFFLVCGVAAALAHLVTNWGSADGAIGASGAIAGVMAAGLRMVPSWAPLGR